MRHRKGMPWRTFITLPRGLRGLHGEAVSWLAGSAVVIMLLGEGLGAAFKNEFAIHPPTIHAHLMSPRAERSDACATGPAVSPEQRESPTPAPPPGKGLTPAARVPLVDGLVIVSVVADERGDYESVKRIAKARDRLIISISATLPVDGRPTEFQGSRVVLNGDLEAGRIYRIAFRVYPAGQNPGPPEIARGTTALGVSAEVLKELRTEGRSEFSLASIEQTGKLLSAFGLPSPEYEGSLERIEPVAVPVAVLLDGERHWLPAVHAKGTFEGLTGEVDAELWILDNLDNPLTLRFIIGDSKLQVTRIDRPQSPAASVLEKTLADDERFDLRVYFEFASARLRPESDPAIAEVVDVLRRHPDWRLKIEGHTDDIGGNEFNLKLSRQRAEAVRDAIAARLGGSVERLETAGYGASQPRESNGTAEGRARNRRVEIFRFR